MQKRVLRTASENTICEVCDWAHPPHQPKALSKTIRALITNRGLYTSTTSHLPTDVTIYVSAKLSSTAIYITDTIVSLDFIRQIFVNVTARILPITFLLVSYALYCRDCPAALLLPRFGNESYQRKINNFAPLAQGITASGEMEESFALLAFRNNSMRRNGNGYAGI